MTLRSPLHPAWAWEGTPLRVGGVCSTGEALVQASGTYAVLPDTEEGRQAILLRLQRIIIDGMIRGRYTNRIYKGRTTAPWYSGKRGQRSYGAVLFFNENASSDNLIALVEQGLVTSRQLANFARTTRLSATNEARVERALRQLGTVGAAPAKVSAPPYTRGRAAVKRRHFA